MVLFSACVLSAKADGRHSGRKTFLKLFSAAIAFAVPYTLILSLLDRSFDSLTSISAAIAFAALFAGVCITLALRHSSEAQTKLLGTKSLLLFFIFSLLFAAFAVPAGGRLLYINNASKTAFSEVNTIILVGVAFFAFVFLFFYCIFIAFSAEKENRKALKKCICLFLVFGVVISGTFSWGYFGIKTAAESVALPVSSASEISYTPPEKFDFYVDSAAAENGDGSKDKPFSSIEAARDYIRTLDKSEYSGIRMGLTAGEYRVSGIEFTKEDSGTQNCPISYCAVEGDVVLNGGVTLSPEPFSPVTDSGVLSRLSEEAQKNVVCTELSSVGLTADDWGVLYATGGYNTASHYDGAAFGVNNCELFFNGQRMTLARYPNSGFLYTKGIVREGEGRESSTSNHVQREGWDSLGNPVSDIFKIDSEVAERINSYSSLENVWVWEALMYNWADATSPILNFNYEEKTIEPKYVSTYGAISGTTYYIFNALPELDSPGEWYLDRDSGELYLYAPAELEQADIMFSVARENIITITDAEYISIKGISVCGTRGSGISVTGNNNTVAACHITDASGNGVLLNGSNNSVENCELSAIGSAAVVLNGGDKETLTPGNNKADNNIIHDYSQIAVTAGPGVSISGVGNICSHNGIFNAPQQAVFYFGNNHIIEYNNIHDVALLSDDCNATYSGRSWNSYGTIQRYNCFYNMGDSEHYPNAIYYDDGLSGQTAYGNIIIGCKGSAFLLGGGRDITVQNNIIINSETPISYDDRAREGALDKDCWFKHSMQGEDMWQALFASPWQSDIWKNAYPEMTRFSDDFNNTDSPDFVPNPAYSDISGNLIVNLSKNLGNIADSAYRFSKIENNAVFGVNSLDDIFLSVETGDYTLKSASAVYDILPDFENIDLSKIGRY